MRLQNLVAVAVVLAVWWVFTFDTKPTRQPASPVLTAEQKAQKAEAEELEREENIARVLARLAVKETYRDPKIIDVQATLMADEYYWVNVEFDGINALKQRLVSEVKTVFIWKDGEGDGWTWSFEPEPAK